MQESEMSFTSDAVLHFPDKYSKHLDASKRVIKLVRCMELHPCAAPKKKA